eukprot:3695788-Pyramimonas_sp.AAC.1
MRTDRRVCMRLSNTGGTGATAGQAERRVPRVCPLREKGGRRHANRNRDLSRRRRGLDGSRGKTADWQPSDLP